ncbi:MAG: leucine-rich repeat domain-containing protein, partial [Clostridiales bacterium]|nr:leucine-rich repeat domain-containing protein [Clostridiales bacterium]
MSTPKTRVASGILPQGGYHTIELPSAIGVSPGEEYMVWVKLSGNFYYGHPDKSLALNKSYLVAGGKIYNSEILFGINVYVNQVDYNNYLIINSEQPVNGELSPEDSIISFNDYISKDQGFSKISLKDEKGNELEKSIIINGKDLIIKELPENHINGKLVLLIPKDTLKSTKGQNMYKDYERQFYVYVQASAEVQFKDPILEEIIRSKLNKPTGVIAAGDMRTLIRLDASYCGITNLSGLEYAVKLQYLSLNDNKIISLKLLSCLYELSTLNIQNNYIKDISPLRNLTNLTNLNIMGNAIQDIWPLENLKALKSLNVSNNRISDIYPLHGLRNLTKLDVSANYIKDIYPLKIIAETNNTNLDLNLAENSIDFSDGSEASAILDIL